MNMKSTKVDMMNEIRKLRKLLLESNQKVRERDEMLVEGTQAMEKATRSIKEQDHINGELSRTLQRVNEAHKEAKYQIEVRDGNIAALAAKEEGLWKDFSRVCNRRDALEKQVKELKVRCNLYDKSLTEKIMRIERHEDQLGRKDREIGRLKNMMAHASKDATRGARLAAAWAEAVKQGIPVDQTALSKEMHSRFIECKMDVYMDDLPEV